MQTYLLALSVILLVSGVAIFVKSNEKFVKEALQYFDTHYRQVESDSPTTDALFHLHQETPFSKDVPRAFGRKLFKTFYEDKDVVQWHGRNLKGVKLGGELIKDRFSQLVKPKELPPKQTNSENVLEMKGTVLKENKDFSLFSEPVTLEDTPHSS